MDEIAIGFPELRIVMAHLGHPWQTDTIAVIRKHPHVYADVSAGFYRPWSFYNAMRLATEWNVLPKLLLGSDFPVATPRETIEGLRAVNAPIEGTAMPRVPDDAIEAIISRDSLALLGLSG
jgi:predicted TIM-barrel fold metal-dependent hydrolase